MQALQSHDLLSSDTHAMDQLQDFLRQPPPAHEPVKELETFEQELHRLFVAAEREALGHELARFDLDVPALDVGGGGDHRVLRCATTSTSAAGPVRVERSLYQQVPRSPRRNALPVKRIDGALLMGHKNLAGALIELKELGKTSSCTNSILHHAPEAFDGVEVMSTVGR